MLIAEPVLGFGSADEVVGLPAAMSKDEGDNIAYGKDVRVLVGVLYGPGFDSGELGAGEGDEATADVASKLLGIAV